MFQDGFISSPQKKNRNKDALFTDTDYTEQNQNYNRVRDYSFCRVEFAPAAKPRQTRSA